MDSQGETEAIANPESAVSARDSGTAVAWIADHHAGQVARGMGNRYRNLPNRDLGTRVPAGRAELWRHRHIGGGAR